MEASALQAPVGFARSRISIGAPLLRLRSDQQLVSQFRTGDEDAFRVIHDRYRQRLFAYTRQMLPSRQDAEDVLQDVFVRAYAGLRASDRDLALRAWLYRIAHNRCVDELRRPVPPPPEVIHLVPPPVQDPIAQAEQRESLRRLIADVRRLPDQQRSALLMRELSGMTYVELAGAMDISVPAVKSLLVRARVSLVRSMEARETACTEIRQELILAHDRGRRPEAMARRHLRDCAPCCQFRAEIRGFSRQIAALLPALGPAGMLANLLGFGGGAGGGAAAGGSAAAGGGTCAASGLLAGGAGHVATLLAAAAVTAGGAVEIQHSLESPGAHRSGRPAIGLVAPVRSPDSQLAPGSAPSGPSSPQSPVAAAATPPTGPAVPPASIRANPRVRTQPTVAPHASLPPATTDPGSNPVSAAMLNPSMGPGPMTSPEQSATPSPAVPRTPGAAGTGGPAGTVGPAGTGGSSSPSTAPLPTATTGPGGGASPGSGSSAANGSTAGAAPGTSGPSLLTAITADAASPGSGAPDSSSSHVPGDSGQTTTGAARSTGTPRS